MRQKFVTTFEIKSGQRDHFFGQKWASRKIFCKKCDFLTTFLAT